MIRHTRCPSQAALLALALLFPAGGAAAATFTVSNLADSGPGSLRQAVLDANAAPGADAIAFSSGLTGTVTLTSGQIVIADPLIVQGPGAHQLTVSGNDQFRIFLVEKAATPVPIAVTLSGLTLTRGRGLPATSFSFGGAVFSIGEDLSILDSVISDSVAGLQIDPPFEGCGGNVALLASTSAANSGSLRIVNSLLTGGSVLGFGAESGGNLCVSGGKVIVERSTLSGGSGTKGGGFFAEGLSEDSTILLSTITGNDAEHLGGGVYNHSIESPGVLTIDSSTISGNTLPDFGAGGGISVTRGEVRIFNSTISGNEAGMGGGLFQQGSTVQILNSTLSGNTATENAGGIFYAEIGVGSLLVRLTTVTGNSTPSGAGSLVIASQTGAGAVQLDHAILANGGPVDISGFGAAPVATLTANYSLIEAPGTTVLLGGNNRTGVDPLLGPLANHGGSTLTHRLLPGSPALDAGNPAIPSPPTTDQRGRARIEGPAIDLGAVEGIFGILQVPTLSQLGLLVLGASLFAAGLLRLRHTRA